MTARFTRRDVILSIPALVASTRAFAQAPAASIRVTGINHVTLSVSDVKRSVDFYQGLFGMPIVSRQGDTRGLRIGAGPQHLGISASGTAAPNINHICLGVDGFDVDRITGALAARGFMKSDLPGNAGGGGLGGGPMTMRVRVRGPETGGGRDGTPELYFSDADGIVMQLQDASYCSGSGRLGNLCAAVDPAPKAGVMQVRGWSHCTIFASDGARAAKFYEELFGLKVQAFQGPGAPVYGVGGKGEFLMFAGGGGGRGRANAAPRMGTINHLCMNMDNFEPGKVIKALESYGIKPRGPAQGPAGPLVHYISLRMENRGGAKDGTPELYFTDPDGLLIQLQDTTYCGGAGGLGEICTA